MAGGVGGAGEGGDGGVAAALGEGDGFAGERVVVGVGDRGGEGGGGGAVGDDRGGGGGEGGGGGVGGGGVDGDGLLVPLELPSPALIVWLPAVLRVAREGVAAVVGAGEGVGGGQDGLAGRWS